MLTFAHVDEGTFFYANGSSYNGTWNDNQKHGEGVFLFPDNRIYAGVFINDRIDDTVVSGENLTNPRVSEEISTQVRLNIGDILNKFPDHRKSFKNVDNVRETNELERLLLRYHTYLKQLHRRYSDATNRRRAKIDIIDINTYDKYMMNWPRIEQVMFQARNFNKRLFCMNMFQMRKFLRECGIVDDATFNTYDLDEVFRQMREHHRNIALERQIEYRRLLFADKLDELELFPTDESAATINTLSQNIYGPPEFQPNTHSDHRQPILDREFVELLIRAVIERSLRQFGPSENTQNLSLFQIVFKALADKVLFIFSTICFKYHHSIILMNDMFSFL